MASGASPQLLRTRNELGQGRPSLRAFASAFRARSRRDAWRAHLVDAGLAVQTERVRRHGDAGPGEVVSVVDAPAIVTKREAPGEVLAGVVVGATADQACPCRAPSDRITVLAGGDGGGLPHHTDRPEGRRSHGAPREL